jgi:MoxR-like ATPase
LFGPVDLSQLRKGLVETRTEGMLPEAELAFLDEVFLGSTAILNTLLGLLNERKFRRGHTVMDCPLRVCVAASNSVPDEPALAAFADRFVLRMYVGPIGESRLEELLDGGWNLGAVPNAQANMGDIDVLRAAARAADVAPVRPVLAHAIRLLRSQGIPLSDRRVVKAQKLAASAAVLSGRTVPTAADIWPLVYAVPTAEDQSLARDTLRELLEQAENSALPHAAAQASLGPAARAALLAKRGETVLATPDEDVATWRLKLQALLREIDAGFDPNARPEAVAQLRTQLADALGDV